ncbi:hypothetical protein QQ045_013782 [Rhodiola kirilowii]
MFLATDSNNSYHSFTVSYSDQSLLYSSKLLDDDIDKDDNNPNPYSPFSFDQFYTHSPFFPSNHEQQPELQNCPWVQHDEEPIITAYEEFTTIATSNNSTGSTAGYCTTENIQGNNSVADNDGTNRISTTMVGPVNKKTIHMVRTNGNKSKKDRHSKINTAQGPRDRRMRLSLDIAQRFFGLQDMLGFDKASKTVDWLLSKSQSEINKVSRSKRNDANSVSDSFGASECCEEVSEVVNKNDVYQSGVMDTDKVNKMSRSKEKRSGKVSVLSRRDGFNNLAKESREKARARARERTKEKMLICNSQSHSKQDQHMIPQARKPDLFNLGPQYAYVDQGHTMIDQDETLGNTSYWNPSPAIFNYLQQQISSETSQQMQFGDTHC